MENSSPVDVPPEPLVKQHAPGAEASDALPTGYYYYDPALSDLYPGDNDPSVVPGWFYYDPAQTEGGLDWPYRGVPPRHMLHDPSLYEQTAGTTQQADTAAAPATEVRATPESETESPALETPSASEASFAEVTPAASPTVESKPESAEPAAVPEPVAEKSPEPAVTETPAPPAIEESKPVLAEPEPAAVEPPPRTAGVVEEKAEPIAVEAPAPTASGDQPEPEAARSPKISGPAAKDAPAVPASEITPERLKAIGKEHLPEPTREELPVPAAAAEPSSTGEPHPVPPAPVPPEAGLSSEGEEFGKTASPPPDFGETIEAARVSAPAKEVGPETPVRAGSGQEEEVPGIRAETPTTKAVLVSGVPQEPMEHPAPERGADGTNPSEPDYPRTAIAGSTPFSPEPDEALATPPRVDVPVPTPPPAAGMATERRDTPRPDIHEPGRVHVSASDETVALSSFSFLKSREEPTAALPEAGPVEAPQTAPIVEPERTGPAAPEPVVTAQADPLPAESLKAPEPAPPSPVAERFTLSTPDRDVPPATPGQSPATAPHPTGPETPATPSGSSGGFGLPASVSFPRRTTEAAPGRAKPSIPGLPSKPPEPVIPEAKSAPAPTPVPDEEILPPPRLTLPTEPERAPSPSLPSKKLPPVFTPSPGKQTPSTAPTEAEIPTARAQPPAERSKPAPPARPLPDVGQKSPETFLPKERKPTPSGATEGGTPGTFFPPSAPIKQAGPAQSPIAPRPVLRKVPSLPPPAKPAAPPEPAASRTPEPVQEEAPFQREAPLVPVGEPAKPAKPESLVEETRKPVPPIPEAKAPVERADESLPVPAVVEPAADAQTEKPSRTPAAKLTPINRASSMIIQSRPPMTPIRESARTVPVEPGKLVLEPPTPPPGKVEAVPIQFQPHFTPAQQTAPLGRNLPALLAVGLACLAAGFLSGFFIPRTGAPVRETSSTANTGNANPGRRPVSVEAAAKSEGGLTKAEQTELDKAFATSKSGDLAEALKLFSELEKKHPEWPSMSIELGRIRLYEKNMNAAHDALAAAANNGIMPGDANFLLGLLYMTTRGFTEAEAGFAKATAIDPARPDFYYFWGECLRREGKPLEAIDRFRSAMLRNQYETADGLYRLKFWLSKIQADQEDTEDIARQIENGLRLSRPPMEALFASAARAIKMGQLGAATDLIRKARSLVEPSVYAVIMQDPTFVQESGRPEFAEFYKTSTQSSSETSASNAAPPVSAADSAPAAPSPAKGGGSSRR